MGQGRAGGLETTEVQMIHYSPDSETALFKRGPSAGKRRNEIQGEEVQHTAHHSPQKTEFHLHVFLNKGLVDARVQ